MLTLLKNISVTWVALLALASAPTNPDFSGSWVPQNKRANDRLRAVQTESTIEVTTIQADKSLTNRFPLDGSEGDYVTETGVHGRCKARFSKDALVLEVMTRLSISLLRRETWQLSKDGKTLSVKTEVECPDMPPQVAEAAFPGLPRTDKYMRAEVE